MKTVKSNPKKALSITNALMRHNAEDRELKYLAQRAMVSYIRSVFLLKDKEVFKVKEIPLDLLSQSYGLIGAPEIQFLTQDESKKVKKSKLSKLRAKIDAIKEEKRAKKALEAKNQTEEEGGDVSEAEKGSEFSGAEDSDDFLTMKTT
jgi:ATP-dependent RNA helicase DDX10/DBP4